MKKALGFLLMAVLLTGVLSPALSETMTVGILQFAEHPSLDNCRYGFIQGMADMGFREGENVVYDYKNAQADMGVNAQIAQGFADRQVTLILGIATPSAMAAFNAAEPYGIPVIYSAITDPIAAMLARDDRLSGKNVTGTSDKLPVEKQLQMIRSFLPDASKIGILYTTSEVNSESAIKEYEAKAGDFGFEIVPMGIATGADIPMAMDALLPKVECLCNLTDNTVVSYLPVVLDKANTAGIPVFGSEVEQVKNGCAASEGLDYVSLGRQTGILAARVLQGEDAGVIPFEQIVESRLYVNQAVLDRFGITMTQEDIDRAEFVSND